MALSTTATILLWQSLTGASLRGAADATASAKIQYCAPCSLVHALDIFALQLYGPASYAISYGRFTQLLAFIFENLEI